MVGLTALTMGVFWGSMAKTVKKKESLAIYIDCGYWISDGEPDKKSRALKFNSQSNLFILHFLILSFMLHSV